MVKSSLPARSTRNAITNFQHLGRYHRRAFIRPRFATDDWWELRFPTFSLPVLRIFGGTIEDASAAGLAYPRYKEGHGPRAFFFVRKDRHPGPPTTASRGVLFPTTAAQPRKHTVPQFLYPLEATNPVGEQYLGPFGKTAALGPSTSPRHLGHQRHHRLGEARARAPCCPPVFPPPDDVVTANGLRAGPAAAAEGGTYGQPGGIGLGIMGPPAMPLVPTPAIRYGSDEGQEFAAPHGDGVWCVITATLLHQRRACPEQWARARSWPSRVSLYDNPQDDT
jgi:ribonucleoside-diphosphate reductase alpha chain